VNKKTEEKGMKEENRERERKIRGVTFVFFLLLRIFVRLDCYKYLSLLSINSANEDKIKKEK